MRRVVAVVAFAAAALGLVAWATVGDDDPPAREQAAVAVRARADDPTPRSTAGPATTAPPTTRAPTTTTTAPALPVPEPLPADDYAPTPEVHLGTLALPSIGVTAPLGEGVTLTALDRGPGHWPGTAMPGQLGNVVVAGHRVTHTRPFHNLDLLEPGDSLVFTLADGTTWTYRHESTEIVASDALYIVDQTPAHTATLFACHPKGSAAQRIVAHFTLRAPAP